MVKDHYKKEEKEQRKNKNKKVVKGGFAPALIPIGVAIAYALGSKLASDLYDFVKKKDNRRRIPNTEP